MGLSDRRVRDVGALFQLPCCHHRLDLRRLDQSRLKLLRVFQSVTASALIDLQHPGDRFGMLPCEGFAHVEDAVGVEVCVPEEQPRAGVQFGLGHVRIEAGPGIHLTALQGPVAVGMLQQDRPDVVLAQARLGQSAQQEDVGVGTSRDRHGLAAQIGDALDLAVRPDDQRGPFGLRVGVDRLDRQAGGPTDDRGTAGRGAEIEGAAAQELQRLVGTKREHPADLGTVFGEFLLQPTLVLQQDGDGIVVGPVDADPRGRIGGRDRGGCREICGDQACGRKGGGGQGQEGTTGRHNNSPRFVTASAEARFDTRLRDAGKGRAASDRAVGHKKSPGAA